MEDYAIQIGTYLPIKFVETENGTYIEYLVDAYLQNIEAENYQSAFIAFHMLYMSFIYKTIWLLRKERYENAGFFLNQVARGFSLSSSPFDFSILEEKSAFQILRCLSFLPTEIESFSLSEDIRNQWLKASGIFRYSQEAAEQLISNEMQYAENIFKKTLLCLDVLFQRFINDNWNAETREFMSAKDSAVSFISQNFLSLKDLELLTSLSINELVKDSKEIKDIYIKILCLIFLFVIQTQSGSSDNLLLHYLPSLLKDFNKQVDVSLEALINDEFSVVMSDFPEKDINIFAKIVCPRLSDFRPLKIFICCAKEDRASLNALKKHLKLLQLDELIEVRNDLEILAGAEREKEINKHLYEADIILPLISSDFMSSDFSYKVELKRAVERNEKNEARTILIILKHVYWEQEALKGLQVLPTGAEPIVGGKWRNKDVAFSNVSRSIYEVVMEMLISNYLPS